MLIATLRVVMGAITILMYVSRAICDLIRLLITYLLSANAIAPKPKRDSLLPRRGSKLSL